jgi:hypothetical protein
LRRLLADPDDAIFPVTYETDFTDEEGHPIRTLSPSRNEALDAGDETRYLWFEARLVLPLRSSMRMCVLCSVLHLSP